MFGSSPQNSGCVCVSVPSLSLRAQQGNVRCNPASAGTAPEGSGRGLSREEADSVGGRQRALFQAGKSSRSRLGVGGRQGTGGGPGARMPSPQERGSEPPGDPGDRPTGLPHPPSGSDRHLAPRPFSPSPPGLARPSARLRFGDKMAALESDGGARLGEGSRRREGGLPSPDRRLPPSLPPRSLPQPSGPAGGKAAILGARSAGRTEARGRAGGFLHRLPHLPEAGSSPSRPAQAASSAAGVGVGQEPTPRSARSLGRPFFLAAVRRGKKMAPCPTSGGRVAGAAEAGCFRGGERANERAPTGRLTALREPGGGAGGLRPRGLRAPPPPRRAAAPRAPNRP